MGSKEVLLPGPEQDQPEQFWGDLSDWGHWYQSLMPPLTAAGLEAVFRKLWIHTHDQHLGSGTVRACPTLRRGRPPRLEVNWGGWWRWGESP